MSKMFMFYYDENGKPVAKETKPSPLDGIMYDLDEEDYNSNNQKRTTIDLIDISR